MPVYAGVDLGATKIRAVVATADRTVLGAAKQLTPAATIGVDVTDAVIETLKAACEDADVPLEEVQSVGVGSFGPLDLASGSVVRPANLPDAVEEIPLREPLETLVGEGRVTLQNDTVAGVVAERAYGDHHPDDMVYLTISSGIGAGVCVDGNVLRGWDGNAGEVGHFTVDPAGAMACGCGSPGHWEAYCSGENIPRYAEYLHETEGYETSLSFDGLEAADVFAATGDELADRVVERLADWNTIGFSNVVDAYAPIEIVVGGAVALNNPDRILDPVRERIDDHVTANVPDIRTTNLGDEVVVKGALASVTPERPAADRTRQD